VDPAGGVRRGRELVRLGGGPPERLLRQHVLAGRDELGDHLGVREVREREADPVDGVVVEHGIQVCGRGGEAVPVGDRPGKVLVEVDDGRQADVDAGEVGVHRGVAIPERMGLSGHAGAHDCHCDVLVHGDHPIPVVWRVSRVRAAMG
jgi:hypothetical protein